MSLIGSGTGGLLGGGGGGGGGGGATVTVDTLATIEALTPAAGDLGFPTDSRYQLRCESAGTWAYYIDDWEATRPPSTGWTAIGTDGNSAQNSDGSRRFYLGSTAAGAFVGEYRAEPADEYWVKMAMQPNHEGTTIWGNWWFGESNGTTAHLVYTYSVQSVVYQASSMATGAASFTFSNQSLGDHGVSWVGIYNDGANVSFYLRDPSGAWTLLHTEAQYSNGNIAYGLGRNQADDFTHSLTLWSLETGTGAWPG